MENYTYFHFSTVDYDTVNERLGGRYDQSPLFKAYRKWLECFADHAHAFYRSQQDRHFHTLLNEFYRVWELDRTIYLADYDESIQEAFTRFLDNSNFNEHYHAMKTAQAEHRSQLERYWPDRPDIILGKDTAAYFLELFSDKPDRPNVILPQIWSLWFDESTHTDETAQEMLRRLPYAEYLKSDHWKRIRAAMLVAHRLRCEGEPCTGLNSWRGHESVLHVHHMHYRSKGGEQLEDLRLLCAECHKQYHEGETDVVPEFNWTLTGY